VQSSGASGRPVSCRAVPGDSRTAPQAVRCCVALPPLVASHCPGGQGEAISVLQRRPEGLSHASPAPRLLEASDWLRRVESGRQRRRVTAGPVDSSTALRMTRWGVDRRAAAPLLLLVRAIGVSQGEAISVLQGCPESLPDASLATRLLEAGGWLRRVECGRQRRRVTAGPVDSSTALRMTRRSGCPDDIVYMPVCPYARMPVLAT
jgi:hypothetical protein